MIDPSSVGCFSEERDFRDRKSRFAESDNQSAQLSS
jgi:hypothetical protein